ncbi:MAG: desulfoferrodoxin [Thermoguttaceae bacterium]
MTHFMEVYVCELCGNIVEVLDEGDGELTCCGQAMTLQKAGSQDAAKEKHVPAVDVLENKVLVKVGEILHPMDANHFIEWIEFWEGNRLQRHRLKPGEEPITEFCTKGGPFVVRAYCNLHGLWQKVRD